MNFPNEISVTLTILKLSLTSSPFFIKDGLNFKQNLILVWSPLLKLKNLRKIQSVIAKIFRIKGIFSHILCGFYREVLPINPLVCGTTNSVFQIHSTNRLGK